MKTVFTKGEGVKMNSSIDFGNATSIINEFEYLMDTTETMWVVEFKYFYRITDDNYIQLAYRMDGGELQLCAQFKLRFKNLKDNIIFIIKENIEAHRLYDGFPVYENSAVFTKQEFEAIIKDMGDEKRKISSLAVELKSPFIQFLEDKGLNPKPTGYTEYSWGAKCPNANGSHHIMVSTKHDEWGCGYCCKKGNQKDLEKWLWSLDQKR